MSFDPKSALKLTAAIAAVCALVGLRVQAEARSGHGRLRRPPPPASDTFTAPPPASTRWARRDRARPRTSSSTSATGSISTPTHYTVRADAQPVLDGQAAWLNRYPAVRVRIEGNADERGTREYNLALGARRANAVRDYLTSRGVSPARIATVSYGKERPIDAGSDEQAWAKNRNARTTITEGAKQ